MLARVLLLGLAAALLVVASGASADEAGGPEPAGARPEERSTSREPVRPRFRWGIPDSPFPLMEAERKLFGFHLEFEFGGGDARRRDRSIR